MKCCVARCPNWSHEGIFKGLLCLPCYRVLSGEGLDKAAIGYIQATLTDALQGSAPK